MNVVRLTLLDGQADVKDVSTVSFKYVRSSAGR